MRLGVDGVGVGEVGSGCGGSGAVCGGVWAGGRVGEGGAAVAVGVSVMSRGETGVGGTASSVAAPCRLPPAARGLNGAKPLTKRQSRRQSGHVECEWNHRFVHVSQKAWWHGRSFTFWPLWKLARQTGHSAGTSGAGNLHCLSAASSRMSRPLVSDSSVGSASWPSTCA